MTYPGRHTRAHSWFYHNCSIGGGVYSRFCCRESRALGFSTALVLDIMASVPSLAFRYIQENPRYPMFCCICTPVELTASPAADSAEYAIGAAILNFSLCYTINLYNLQSCASIFPGDHTTGKLNSITTQAVAPSVLLFSFRIATQFHSTISIVRHLRSVRHVYARHNAARWLTTVYRQGTNVLRSLSLLTPLR